MSKYALTSVKRAWNRAFSIQRWQNDVDEIDLLEWSDELIGLLKVPKSLSSQVYVGEVVDKKATLPPCIENFIGVAGYPNGSIEDCADTPIDRMSFKPMRYASDIFHRYCSKMPNCNGCELTYTVNDDCMFPSFENGLFLLAYESLPVDENGYPMIPDEQSVINALAYHILTRIAAQKWARQEIPEGIYRDLERNSLWYKAKAQTRVPTYDEMETLKNIHIRMIPKVNMHSDGFNAIGSQELRIAHNNHSGRYYKISDIPRYFYYSGI